MILCQTVEELLIFQKYDFCKAFVLFEQINIPAKIDMSEIQERNTVNANTGINTKISFGFL